MLLKWAKSEQKVEKKCRSGGGGGGAAGGAGGGGVCLAISIGLSGLYMKVDCVWDRWCVLS